MRERARVWNTPYGLSTLHVPRTPIGRSGRPLKPIFLFTPKFVYAWKTRRNREIGSSPSCQSSNALSRVLQVAISTRVQPVLVFASEYHRWRALVADEPIPRWRQRGSRDRRTSPRPRTIWDYFLVEWLVSFRTLDEITPLAAFFASNESYGELFNGLGIL